MEEKAYCNIDATLYGNDPLYFDVYNMCHHLALWIAYYNPLHIDRSITYTAFDLVGKLNLWYDKDDPFFAIDPLVMAHSFRGFHGYL